MRVNKRLKRVNHFITVEHLFKQLDVVLGSLSQLIQWQDKTKYTELTLNTNTKLTFLNFFTIPDEPLLVLVYCM